MGQNNKTIRSEMMTLKQLAAHFNLHRQTVGKLASSGEIPAMRIGGEWRFDLNKVEKALYERGKRTC